MDQLAPVLDPVEQEEQAEAALLAEQLRQSDEQAFSGPETIAGYNFGQPPAGVERSADQELAMRTLFLQEGIPAGLGSEIGRIYNAAIANPPSGIDREVQYQRCQIKLEQMWGTDAPKNIAIVQAEVQRMAKTNPGIIGMLDSSGLGNNPWLASTLLNLATVKGRVR
jgi:hypothetical protein